MRRKIGNYFKEFWKWIRKILTDNCGELPFGDGKPDTEHSDEIVEREIVINNTKIHIKSIFTAKTSLDRALQNIVARKISDAKSDQ